MRRVPEPEELMDDPEQALAYAEADFSEPNGLFLDLFEQLIEPPFQGLVLDLGCGPGDIPIEFVCRHPSARVHALDGAPAMLALGRDKAQAFPRLQSRITWRCDFLPCADLSEQSFDAVLSNSLLHHLADPGVMWRTLATCAKPGAPVVVMDLLRPESEQAVDALVSEYAADASELLRRDFRNSLFAAYTLEEVQSQLVEAGLGFLQARQVSDRHLAVSGIMRA